MTLLGRNIKAIRRERGYNQTELGNRAGMHFVTISRIETGAHMPNWDAVCRIADALKVSTEEFRRKRKISSASN